MLKEPFRSRLASARRLARHAKVDALLVAPSMDFTYLTGRTLIMRERPLFLVLTPSSEALLCPRLEAGTAGAALGGIKVWPWADGEDPMALLRKRVPRARRFAVNSTMRADWVLALAGSSPHPALGSGAPVLDALRERKEPGEIRLLKAAALQADKVMAEVRARLKPGVSEEEIATFVLDRFVRLGARDPWVIVGSGENGALPHHEFGPRKMRRGDVVVVDLGAQLHGYQSDITRTFFLGEPEPEARRVYAVVLAAQAAGRAAVWAGVQGCEADRAARELIARHKYGKYFIHRLGHGLGMDIHESPYLSVDNATPLPENAVVTVEPGIYLPGRFGVRLEDVVVARRQGPLTLTESPLDQPRVP